MQEMGVVMCTDADKKKDIGRKGDIFNYNGLNFTVHVSLSLPTFDLPLIFFL